MDLNSSGTNPPQLVVSAQARLHTITHTASALSGTDVHAILRCHTLISSNVSLVVTTTPFSQSFCFLPTGAVYADSFSVIDFGGTTSFDTNSASESGGEHRPGNRFVPFCSLITLCNFCGHPVSS